MSEINFAIVWANKVQNISLALGTNKVGSKCKKKGLLGSDSFQLEAWIIILASWISGHLHIFPWEKVKELEEDK